MAGEPVPAVGSAGPVPWTADLLRPIVGEIVPAAERADLRKKLSLAEKVGPEAVEIVREKGHWPEATKTTLVTSGSRCAAKWLNRSGLSAEYSDEVAICGALAAIFASNRVVYSALRKMISEKEEARAREAAAASAPADAAA